LIVHPGLINVDFADVKTIMCNMGRALMGTGYGKGKDRAIEAARMAIASPLLDEVSVEGATGILLNFTAGPEVKLGEIEAAASLVQESAHEDANIIFGVVTDASMGDMVKVTVIATGFEYEQPHDVRPSHAAYPAGAQRSSFAPQPMRGQLQMRPGSEQGRVSYTTGAVGPGRLQGRKEPQGEPALVSATRPSGFGSSALHDERVLDIPAYLRRGNNHHE
ncbi:MAG: cell division protein FtsZ, partial [Polyangiales bacterium]